MATAARADRRRGLRKSNWVTLQCPSCGKTVTVREGSRAACQKCLGTPEMVVLTEGR